MPLVVENRKLLIVVVDGQSKHFFQWIGWWWSLKQNRKSAILLMLKLVNLIALYFVEGCAMKIPVSLNLA